MKVDRLVSIILILLDKKRIAAQELADMFEVSPRTIYRDIDAINMAGIPVRSTSGVGGGFEIMQEYKIDQKFFSTDDLSALLMQPQYTAIFRDYKNSFAKKQASDLCIYCSPRKQNRTNRRAVSACIKGQSLVLTGILPQKM